MDLHFFTSIGIGTIIFTIFIIFLLTSLGKSNTAGGPPVNRPVVCELRSPPAVFELAQISTSIHQSDRLVEI